MISREWPRWGPRLGLLAGLGAALVGACGSDDSGGAGANGSGASGGDAGNGGSGNGGKLDGGTPADASTSDGSVVNPVPGEGECAWTPGERPTAQLPDEHASEYVIELGRWQISDAAQEPVQTRKGINDAIRWAKDNGYDKIVLPPGNYLVGEATNDAYQAGVELEGDMTFELADGAVLQMAPNDRWNYCVISVNGNSNVTIRGGEVLGDRDLHDYGNPERTGHDEGHGICVWTAVDRVLIEDIELHELTGDGVLIVGDKQTDSQPEKPSTNITIRNSQIHHNRRQGVSIVGAHDVVIEDNHIHHIQGTSPQFGIDIEGAGRRDQDIHIHRNVFDHNAGGDFVTSTGHNVWFEDNDLTQCQTNDAGVYDPALPCDLDKQVDGPIILWKETDNVILNNRIRMSLRTVNGFWGILGYVSGSAKSATRDNPIGNYIAGNTLFDAGIHMAHNMRYFVSNNTIHNGLMLGYNLACTRLEDNRINRTASEHYKLRDVAGVATRNILNRSEGADPAEDRVLYFPMADDAPYRNSSPVFW
ncbi:MAG: right-handed parallel beta-helix repeat-containing protein [Myxococcales bacterium]|nr:right-handed parallel beta-helix repeat-containing protein [Myxococcales bacterium]